MRDSSSPSSRSASIMTRGDSIMTGIVSGRVDVAMSLEIVVVDGVLLVKLRVEVEAIILTVAPVHLIVDKIRTILGLGAVAGNMTSRADVSSIQSSVVVHSADVPSHCVTMANRLGRGPMMRGHRP